MVMIHLLYGVNWWNFTWATQVLFKQNSFNSSPPNAAYMRHWTGWVLVQVMARQAITWTNADLLSIGPLGTNFS